MNLMESWNSGVIGLLILFGILLVFAALVVLIRKTGAGEAADSQSAERPAGLQAVPVPAASPAAAPGGVLLETVAVISAAVAAMMEEEAPGVPYAITEIQPQESAPVQQRAAAAQRPSGGRRPVWGFAGMQQNTRPF